ncbi:DUF222 domain-containing protein [Candidatus Poriferisodalis sp.]|uniref:HNH endonuclease signature motif containing protein n=1 Tax=Candidatus Poriferisodalis sp. TaxID=3101277 RepID=UPI003B5A134C
MSRDGSNSTTDARGAGGGSDAGAGRSGGAAGGQPGLVGLRLLDRGELGLLCREELVGVLGDIETTANRLAGYRAEVMGALEALNRSGAAPDATPHLTLRDAAGVSERDARQMNRIASKARERPEVLTALTSGDINPAQAEALCDARVPEPVRSELVAVAGGEDTDQTRRRVREAETQHSTESPTERFERQRRARRAGWGRDHEGMLKLWAKFDPETGARVEAALEPLRRALWQHDKQQRTDRRTPAQRDADTLAYALAGIALTGADAAMIADLLARARPPETSGSERSDGGSRQPGRDPARSGASRGGEPRPARPDGNEPGGHKPGGHSADEPRRTPPDGNELGGNEPGGNEPGGNEPGGHNSNGHSSKGRSSNGHSGGDPSSNGRSASDPDPHSHPPDEPSPNGRSVGEPRRTPPDGNEPGGHNSKGHSADEPRRTPPGGNEPGGNEPDGNEPGGHSSNGHSSNGRSAGEPRRTPPGGNEPGGPRSNGRSGGDPSSNGRSASDPDPHSHPPDEPSPNGRSVGERSPGGLDDARLLGQRLPPAQISVLIGLDALRGDTDEAGLTDAGTELAPETVRRLACDSELIPVILGGPGGSADIGRARRTVPARLRRLLIARDRHCRWPGCREAPSRCDAHHIIHWSAGGPTDLGNLVLLCHAHHHHLHEHGYLLVPGPDGSWTPIRPSATAPPPAANGQHRTPHPRAP